MGCPVMMFYDSLPKGDISINNIPHYGFCCAECIFRECWSPGVRTTDKSFGEKIYGSKLRVDEHEIYTCTWMFDFGCPDNPKVNDVLGRKRIEKGWRSSVV